jgi:hypothetical protein
MLGGYVQAVIGVNFGYQEFPFLFKVPASTEESSGPAKAVNDGITRFGGHSDDPSVDSFWHLGGVEGSSLMVISCNSWEFPHITRDATGWIRP